MNDRRYEKGAMTIIEATFVFPITFFIVLFMLMAGEAYYQRACVELAVTEAAVNGAARCENPMLAKVIESGVPTSPSEVDVLPYRYILVKEAKKIGTSVESDLDKKINGFTPLLFKNMKPTDVNVKVDPKMNMLVSSLPVTCEFKIPMPIKMIFSDQDLGFKYKVSTTASIGDPSEFVRNVSIVSDLIERNAELSEWFTKMGDGVQKIGNYTN